MTSKLIITDSLSTDNKNDLDLWSKNLTAKLSPVDCGSEESEILTSKKLISKPRQEEVVIRFAVEIFDRKFYSNLKINTLYDYSFFFKSDFLFFQSSFEVSKISKNDFPLAGVKNLLYFCSVKHQGRPIGSIEPARTLEFSTIKD